MKSLGIDLTGSEKRASGVALLDGNNLDFTKRLHTDSELEETIINASADIPIYLGRHQGNSL